MKKIISIAVFIITAFVSFAQHTSRTAVWNNSFNTLAQDDWLVKPPTAKANVYSDEKEGSLILYNGLVRRSFGMSPNFSCYDFQNMATSQQLLRAIRPEAKLIIDGKEYNVGGVIGQQEKAYLQQEWMKGFKAGADDFIFTGYTVSDIKPYINWKRTTWASVNKQATGKELMISFASPLPSLKDITVVVHYELYDGLPLMVKWIEVKNNSIKNIVVNRIVNESLGLVEE